MGCRGLGGGCGGLYQGIPRVPPLDSVMASHGTLIPQHHRLEGRPVHLVKQQVRGGGQC